MVTKTYQLETLTCPSCIIKIKAMMRRTDGITNSKLTFLSSKLRVTFDESKIKSEEIKEHVNRLGFEVLGEIPSS